MTADPLCLHLASGLNDLGLTLSPVQQQQLLTYIQLLQKWNRVYNLTAMTDLDQMISHHLLDSLAVLPFIEGQRILDVGSGAGLPGIPLAVALPAHRFTLLDSLAKRTQFLSHVVRRLGLGNVEVVQARMQTYRSAHQFDTITARAVATCREIVEKTQSLCHTSGQWVLLKGQAPEKECEDLPVNTAVLKIRPLFVPGLDKARHCVQIVNLA